MNEIKKLNYTPGPWKAECRDSGYTGGRQPEHYFLQWEVYGPRVPDGRGSFYQDDARLVASAPQMYELLCTLRDQPGVAELLAQMEGE